MRTVLQAKYWTAASAGSLLAFLSWKIMSIEFRYALAVIGGLIVVAAAIVARDRIEDFLVYALVFITPFNSFEKWLFGDNTDPTAAVAAKGVLLGLSEVLLLITYTVWFMKIFVKRSESPPKPGKIDFFIAALLLVQFISSIGAPNKKMAVFDIIFNIKHFLIYFYVSNKLKHKHLQWIVVLLLSAIVLESGLSFYERATGTVGIGMSKGNVQSEDFGSQYLVPELEEFRGAGTTTDSHALGLYFTLLLPVPLVLMSVPYNRGLVRCAAGAVFILGAGGLIGTFSRSGWLSTAIASAFTGFVIMVSWKRKVFLPLVLVLGLAISLFFPKGYSYIYNRFADAPPEILTARYTLNWQALDIWRQHPFFGYGPGNYIDAALDPKILTQWVPDDHRVDPVHNAYLWILAEIGVFGFIAYYGIFVLAMKYSWRLQKSGPYAVRILSLAILAAFVGHLFEGLTNPCIRDVIIYYQLWIYIGIVAGLVRLGEGGGVRAHGGIA